MDIDLDIMLNISLRSLYRSIHLIVDWLLYILPLILELNIS